MFTIVCEISPQLRKEGSYGRLGSLRYTQISQFFVSGPWRCDTMKYAIEERAIGSVSYANFPSDQ